MTTPAARPRRSLSIIIPAYRESANIAGTLENVTAGLEGLALDAEILVIDDGSTDNTSGVVRAELPRFPAVQLLVNERNMGFGWTYRRGVDAASRDHIVMVHGDNAWGAKTLNDLFRRCGEADIIVGYTEDMWGSRTISRTVASKTFTLLINLITWRWLRYYNGLQLHRADVLKSIRIESTGFGFQAEVLAKALRKTKTVIEVPMVLTERTAGESKAFRWKNFKDVGATLWRLVRLEWGGSERASDVRT